MCHTQELMGAEAATRWPCPTTLVPGHKDLKGHSCKAPSLVVPMSYELFVYTSLSLLLLGTQTLQSPWPKAAVGLPVRPNASLTHPHLHRGPHLQAS